jgi:hypothetical protein
MATKDTRALYIRPLGALLASALAWVTAGVILGGHAHPPPLRRLPPVPTLPPAMAALPSADAGAPDAPADPEPSPAQLPAGGPRHFADTIDVSAFQKGNIHTHTTFSDGDHPPQDVYVWYRDRGYNFLAITDHNALTDPALYRLLERKRFVMIPGEEVTMRGAGKQVHVNALCTRHTIGGKNFDTQAEALAWAVREVRKQGGVALINHPNWDWALSPSDLPSARGAQLLEIWSGHPYVHTLGDAARPSHQAIWDGTIAAGLGFAGVAVDDAHIYGPHAPEKAARPGRAWIQVFSAETSRNAICEALAKGRLYASTGVTLKRIVVGGDAYAVYPAEPSAVVEFIGQGGRVLQSGPAGRDGAARYRLSGGEGYVRAHVTAAGGKQAWTQPSRVEPP